MKNSPLFRQLTIRALFLAPALLLGASLGACSDDSGSTCAAGNEGCPCFNGICLAGLTCGLGNVCVPTSGGDGDGDGDPTTGDGDGDGDGCGSGLTSCGGQCVNTQTSSEHCGGCNSPCDAGVCMGGSCNVIDCTVDPCPGFSYCDLGTKQCLPGCAFDSQCDGDFVCNLVTHECDCPSDEILCDGACIPDWQGCPMCGNGVVEGDEDCDGNDLDGESCYSLGWDMGTLSCTNSCTFNTANCGDAPPDTCGNGVLDLGEECDGTLYGGKTCQTLGYQYGNLSCPNCSVSTANCIPYVGSCCAAKETPGCSKPDVVACVCPLDSYCCNTKWDATCVNVANNQCGGC